MTWRSDYLTSASTPKAPLKKVTEDYTLTAGDYVILVDATGSPVDVTLPAATPCARCRFVVKRIAGAAVKVKTTGGELIDGQAEFELLALYDSIEFCSDGTGWWIIAR